MLFFEYIHCTHYSSLLRYIYYAGYKIIESVLNIFISIYLLLHNNHNILLSCPIQNISWRLARGASYLAVF